MALLILDDADGIGSDDLDTLQAFVDLVIIADDDGVGLEDPLNGMQQVTYAPTAAGPPQTRLDALVNTAFTPDYGSGAQNVDTVIIAGLSGFTLDDGSSIANNGTALAPASSGLAGSSQNPTESCLVIYDTQATICVARDGTDGDLDLGMPTPVLLFHELSHAFRIVTNALLDLTSECDPSSPEENAAIVDENDMRTQIAQRQGETPALRDPDIHCGEVSDDCGGCCIIATMASRSLTSPQVASLRCVRDSFVRSTEVGHAFFQRLFYDYYGFSPQVCTIAAGTPEVSRHLLDGYVEPLLAFWQVMVERSRSPLDAEALGAIFVGLHRDPDEARRRLAALSQTAGYWQAGAADGPPVVAELLQVLRERAWPSEHVQWALVAPVRMYKELLARHLEGADARALGEAFVRLLEGWAPEVPISDVWGALARDEVVAELDFCDRRLLLSAASRRRFRDRLRQRFPGVTAITAVLSGEDLESEGAR